MMLLNPDVTPTTQFPHLITTAKPPDPLNDPIITAIYCGCCILIFLICFIFYHLCLFCKDTGCYGEAMKVYLLPNLIFCKDEFKSSHKACAVCAREFNDEEVLKILACEHIFHRDCLRNYIRDYRTVTCPVCFSYVYATSDDESKNLVKDKQEPFIGRSLNYGSVLS